MITCVITHLFLHGCGQRQLSGNDFHIFFTLDARFPVTAPSHNDHNQASATVEDTCQ